MEKDENEEAEKKEVNKSSMVAIFGTHFFVFLKEKMGCKEMFVVTTR